MQFFEPIQDGFNESGVDVINLGPAPACHNIAGHPKGTFNEQWWGVGAVFLTPARLETLGMRVNARQNTRQNPHPTPI
jgi:hypothetical protein